MITWRRRLFEGRAGRREKLALEKFIKTLDYRKQCMAWRIITEEALRSRTGVRHNHYLRRAFLRLWDEIFSTLDEEKLEQLFHILKLPYWKSEGTWKQALEEIVENMRREYTTWSA